jgi:lysophospholipase L1-like esterase
VNSAACLAFLLLQPGAAPSPFDFAEGDRVVLIGGTLVEREQASGYWELALTLRNKDKNVTFRNLGWSGDTVWGESRGSFDGPAKGYAKLVELTKELKPTVILICYGQNESFAGEMGVKAFAEQYEKLLKDLAPTKARFVLLSPPPFEQVAPLKDAKAKNDHLAKYVAATKELAEKQKAGFIDLFAAQPAGTENGVHFDAAGYKRLAEVFGSIPAESTAEALREAIVAKNELFFHRWRPQNFTYLFGFRKGEQGKNGKEIAEFDPLVEKVEKQIAELRKSVR